MKKFIGELTKFFLPAIILYAVFMIFIISDILKYSNGPSTEEQITQSFKNALKKEYEMYIFGNSRIYRGVNPDRFNINSYNFSHDNDSFNQIYYKILYLNNNRKSYKYIILGVDYFQFSFLSDTRNYYYANFLNRDYLNDFNNNSVSFSKVDKYIRIFHPWKLKKISFQKKEIYLKENGQYINPGIAKSNDFAKRNVEILNVQKEYFEKILEYCHQNDILVFLVMPPVRITQMDNYNESDIIKFNEFIRQYSKSHIAYLDYSMDQSYQMDDFTDVTHLNQFAADKFSANLNDTIISILKQKKYIKQTGLNK